MHSMENILEELVAYLTRYMYFERESQPVVLALWILHTFTFSPSFPRAPWTTPYLYLNSTEPGCGKTLLLELIEPLARNTIKAGSITSSAMFRLMSSEECPTLMLDEVDTIRWNGADEDLRNTYNTDTSTGAIHTA